ncbi:MAG: ribosome-associated translation inhibitor RaiA [Bacteroidota bacterium]
MNISVTSRHFKAHATLNAYARESVEKLMRFYDGIVKGEVVLKYERNRNSVKIAEIKVKVYNAVLTAAVSSDDFQKSLDGAAAKLGVQLRKYKDKLRQKNRNEVRRVKEKV